MALARFLGNTLSTTYKVQKLFSATTNVTLQDEYEKLRDQMVISEWKLVTIWRLPKSRKEKM